MRVFSTLPCLLLFVSAAHADSIESNSKVDAVSVFPAAALVRIKVSRITVRDDKAEPGMLSISGTTVLTREFLTRLRNTHKDRRAVVVYDRIPVSEQKDVEVKRVFPLEPGEKETANKRGVTERVIDLAPGEEISFKSSYSISFPYKQVLDIR